MEKAIILFCLILGMACNKTEESESKKKDSGEEKAVESSSTSFFCKSMPPEGLGTFIPPKNVHWMHLDDSLKNICRALNFRLPFMESDIKILPEMITPEILSLSPIRTFELISKERITINDTVTLFHYSLKRDNCLCDVARIYKGKVTDSKFSGFDISEQIVCNAMDELVSLHHSKKAIPKIEKENDSTKYEVHGHEH